MKEKKENADEKMGNDANNDKIVKDKPKGKQKKRCKGLAESGSPCKGSVKNGKQCCERHQDIEHYEPHMFKELKRCNECKKQKHRYKWRYFPKSDMCDECKKNKNDRTGYCQAKQKLNGEPCRLYAVEGGNYCNRNHSHMENYTPYQMANLKKCCQCDKEIYIGDFPVGKKGFQLQSCKGCNGASVVNRQKEKEIRDAKKRCEAINCSYKELFGGFCGVHFINRMRAEAEEQNKIPCRFLNRGCRKFLDLDFEFKACDDCRAEERISDREQTAKQKAECDKILVDSDYTENKCITCHEMQIIDVFIRKNGIISNKCKTCREINENVDIKRNRNDTKTNNSVIEKKKKDANRAGKSNDINDDVLLEIIVNPCYYCGIYEYAKNKDGIEYSKMTFDRKNSSIGYTIDNVVSACVSCNLMKWEVPYTDFIQYCENIYENYGSENNWNDIAPRHNRYCNYSVDAKKRNKDFEITKDEFNAVVTKKCYYCNNTNAVDQIGIDRLNSNVGYVKNNTLVACCKICNKMKKHWDNKRFYNHVLRILFHNKKITKNEFKKKILIVNEKNSLEYFITQLQQLYQIRSNEDRRGLFPFTQSNEHYINQIWRGFDIDTFEPELEFCETSDQIELWMYYRLIISQKSYEKKDHNKDIMILVRDKFTKRYVGFVALGPIPFEITENVQLNKRIYEIKICSAIPPFRDNFSGNKLMVMLMFSTEVYQYVKKTRNIDLIGLAIIAPLKVSKYETIECSSISIKKKFELTGLDGSKVPRNLYDALKIYMRNNNENDDIDMNQTVTVNNFLKRHNIIDPTSNNVTMGFYFGETSNNSLDEKHKKLDLSKLSSVKLIIDKWYIEHAVTTFNEHTASTFKDINDPTLMVEYDYHTYYIDNRGYNRHNQNKYIKNDNILKEILIVSLWNEHKYDAFEKLVSDLSKSYKIETTVEEIKKLIFPYGEISDTDFLKRRENLKFEMDMKQQKIIMLTEDPFGKEIKYMNNFDDQQKHGTSIMIKKTKLYLYVKELNKKEFIKTDFELQNKHNKWGIIFDWKHTFTMQHYKYDKKKNYDSERTTFGSGDSIITKIILSQYENIDTDVWPSDDAPITISNVGSICINLRDQTHQLKISTESEYNEINNHDEVVKLRIENIVTTFHSDQCSCDECHHKRTICTKCV
ncbi:MAG: hypothetical protein Dasosvirus2_36 [Dasosvirus sp.]|uniref:Uncharacterized protein n=1 Tax=Dasosvirus sp. TaxID=2487764 RepID=A0A3G4ZRA1_9VIRU|nr:MAG: hypothetical protein Dasosvirus2_36 [Dasosvirus sp.]